MLQFSAGSSPPTQDAVEAWRAARSWRRHVDLPAEDRSLLGLCARHRVLDLRATSFSGWPLAAEPPADAHFGTLADVVARQDWCALCGLIARSVSHLSYAESAEVLGCWVRDGKCRGSGVTSLRLRIVPEMIGWEDAFEPFDIVPLDEGPEPRLFAGRPIEAGRFNASRLRCWVNSCAEWHGSDCVSARTWNTKDYNAPFIRLLDLELDCIVNVDEPPVYVTLSYVWGTAPVFKTTNENVKELAEPGGLRHFHEDLPRTIQDAIIVAREVGFRYLWVDSLCILQDSVVDKGYQLAVMDRIYAEAALTIVAAGGDDANAGISGLHPGSRNIRQQTARYSAEFTLVSLLPDWQGVVDGSTWNSRGWTYQERVLSRRCLFFTNDTVYFHCSRAIWGEDYHAETPLLEHCAPMFDIELSRSWQPPKFSRRGNHRLSRGGSVDGDRKTGTSPTKDWFDEYSKVMAEYTSRDLTNATDRVRAVGGVLNLYCSLYMCNFICGIPDSYLEAGILWQPTEALKRAVDDQPNGRPLFPSWSWAGWIGGVRYDAPDDCNGHEVKHVVERTKPFTQILPQEVRGSSIVGLAIRTRVAKFKLTLHDRSGKGDDGPRGLARFGITRCAPASADDGEDWLGTIVLPNSTFRRKLHIPHELIILTEAYSFSSDELSWTASKDIEEYAVYDVMLIERLGGTEGSGTSKSKVERVGIGRTVKEAWANLEESWENFLIV
ncbi:hypothetical protein DL770_002497 [Monosporascus sp. CRB-9-2]|nr:hypothetical protein DL770_002497 [Monosporascus sp. CRB-9-2]